MTAVRIAELEAEIVERRKDYSACIRNQDARIAELEDRLVIKSSAYNSIFDAYAKLEAQDAHYIRKIHLMVERLKELELHLKASRERIADLEAQLAAERERERVLIEDLRYALEIVIAYAPNTTDPAWAEDILNKLPAPPEEAADADA